MGFSIKKQSLDKQAAAGIRHQILNGEFGSGFRLVETWLAEQFGLSRGTIRAALSELAHEGLVTQIAYTRWVVTEISGDDIWELFTLRSALEGLGARLAAQMITPDSSKLLSAAYKRLVNASVGKDRVAVTEADFGLHKLIIDLSEHRRLGEQYRLIEQQVRLVIASSNALLPTINDIIGQHEPIVKAILAGNATNSERLVRYHNLTEGKVLADHVRALAKPALFAVPEPELVKSTKLGRKKKK